ncbi:MAG: hypothetical protein Q4G42_08330 [Neisseria sp.]|nr:hypothetical protein [Neisseria sp.]
MRTQAAVLILTLLAATAAVSAAPYSTMTRYGYVYGCTSTLDEQGDSAEVAAQNRRFCTCTLEKMEQKYSEQVFLDAADTLDSAPDNSPVGKLRRDLEKIAGTCSQEVFGAAP